MFLRHKFPKWKDAAPQNDPAVQAWLDRVKREREAAKAHGEHFDGQERDNVLSFEARKDAGKRWADMDTSPSECNPD